jgi:hypothetical protein
MNAQPNVTDDALELAVAWQALPERDRLEIRRAIAARLSPREEEIDVAPRSVLRLVHSART